MQFSINYMHHGAAKQWYAAPQRSATLVEMVAAQSLPDTHASCRNFLRHKTTLIAPEVLVNNGVPLCHLRQVPGDFVITFPRAYHFGFNCGLNCAESTNFALHSWLPLGRTASRCTCKGGEGLASIDMARFDGIDATAGDRDASRTAGPATSEGLGASPKRPLLNPGNPSRQCGTVGCGLPDFHDGPCTTQWVTGHRRSASTGSTSGANGDAASTAASAAATATATAAANGPGTSGNGKR